MYPIASADCIVSLYHIVSCILFYINFCAFVCSLQVCCLYTRPQIHTHTHTVHIHTQTHTQICTTNVFYLLKAAEFRTVPKRNLRLQLLPLLLPLPAKNFLCRVCGPLCFLTCNFFVVVARRISGLLLLFLQHVVAVFLHFVALQGSVEHLKTTFTFVYATLYAALPPHCHAHLQPGGAAVYNTQTPHTDRHTLSAWPTSAYRRIAEAPSRTSFPLRLRPAWKSQFFHMSL